MKKVFALILSVLLFSTVFAQNSQASDNNEIVGSIRVNNKYLEFPAEPYIKNDIIMVPLKTLFDALDIDVKWSSKTKILTASNSKDKITITVGKTNAVVNGVNKKLPIPLEQVNEYTMGPLEFICQTFGFDIVQDSLYYITSIYTKPASKDITLTYTKIPASSERLYFIMIDDENGWTFETYLRGYPDDHKYLLRYEGDTNHKETVIDNRGLDYKAKIKWTYNKKSYTNTRKEIYYLLGNTTKLAQKLNVDVSLLTDDNLKKSFGKIYDEWTEFSNFSKDAHLLVDKFLNPDFDIDGV